MTLAEAIAEYVKWVDEAEERGEYPPSFTAGAALRGGCESSFRASLYRRHPELRQRLANLRARAKVLELDRMRRAVEELRGAGMSFRQAADALGMRRETIYLRLGGSFAKRVIDWDALWADVRAQLPMSFPDIRRRYGMSSRTLQYHVEMNAPDWLGFGKRPMPRQRPTWWAWDIEAGTKVPKSRRRK